MRLRDFGVTGGALRQGARDPCAKGQDAFTQTATGEVKGAIGELLRGYRRIAWVRQENQLRY